VSKKSIKKALKEQDRRIKALLELVQLQDVQITILEQTQTEILQETKIQALNTNTRMKNLLASLETTDEVLEDVVEYLKSLPKFQNGITHTFMETNKHHGNQEVQHHIEEPVSDD
jgi:hypothetical protein